MAGRIQFRVGVVTDAAARDPAPHPLSCVVSARSAPSRVAVSFMSSRSQIKCYLLEKASHDPHPLKSALLLPLTRCPNTHLIFGLSLARTHPGVPFVWFPHQHDAVPGVVGGENSWALGVFRSPQLIMICSQVRERCF